jgi:hypothetical protein
LKASSDFEDVGCEGERLDFADGLDRRDGVGVGPTAGGGVAAGDTGETGELKEVAGLGQGETGMKGKREEGRKSGEN